MDVNDIRARIVELSHHAVGNDVDINAKALGWLNSAYMELMDELIPLAPTRLQVRDNVTTGTDGAAVLGGQVMRLIQAVERGQGKVLEMVSPAELLQAEVGGLTGKPRLCSVSGNVLQVYPAASVEVSLVYVPVVAPLHEDGSEASVLIPASLHNVLVWGGLVWSALFDRGFLSQSELLVYQRQWQSGKEQVRLSLLGGMAPVRVRAFGWI